MPLSSSSAATSNTKDAESKKFKVDEIALHLERTNKSEQGCANFIDCKKSGANEENLAKIESPHVKAIKNVLNVKRRSKNLLLSKKLACSLCPGKVFRHSSSLAYHRKSCHTDEKKHCCEYESCGKLFAHKHLLTIHLLTHSDNKLFGCDVCDLRFKSKASLYVHKRSKHLETNSYTCDKCGAQFNLKSSLKTHLMMHSGERPYACNFCEKKFYSSGNMVSFFCNF